ncbi:PadR family transcriptional regulator [Dongia sp.]|uniref:PadR family transcriptional regulator n=1 Tax=Dongia sp. TaxID=1977262 RepID=UPI0035B252A4
MFFKHLREHCDNHRGDGDRRFARDEFGGGGFFGRGGFGRHGFGRHGRRFGRIFEHGDLRYVVLQMIAEKPRYGYEVIKAIEEKLGGAYTPSPGVIYPTLTLLEETGYATVSEAEGNKKLYAITEAGKAFLAENKSIISAIFDRISETHTAHGGGPAPQLVRAMENLKIAARLRMSQGPLTEEQIRAIAAALDEAAQKIENLK